jgi:hypothetical protein
MYNSVLAVGRFQKSIPSAGTTSREEQNVLEDAVRTQARHERYQDLDEDCVAESFAASTDDHNLDHFVDLTNKLLTGRWTKQYARD